MNSYLPPFQKCGNVIYDSAGKKVKLWGVNYYTPFNSNFYNIEELGKDHYAAIDEDIRHFKLMGIDFIRMHLYDREITDRDGNLVENKNLRVFDYLMNECEKNGIYLMLTPTVWWNTVSNQIEQERYYAYWFIDSQEAFGFSNYYSCDSMIWDPDAIRCQETYLNGLFSHKNTFSGKTLAEYRNIVVIELFNEPQFPSLELIEKEVDPKSYMGNAVFSRGRQRKKLIAMWNGYREKHADVKNENTCFNHFRTELVKRYFEHLWPIVDKYFGDNILRAQFSSYSGAVQPELKELYEQCGIDAITIGTYLNVNGFDAGNTDYADHLDLAKKWFSRFDSPKGNLARISYEFDATATLNGYPLAAIAAMYAKCDVQMAAYFTYTPYAVAAWNPGWLVHYLNIAHTPARAASFAAAGEIFRNHEPEDEILMEPDVWSGSDYFLARGNDLTCVQCGSVFRYSNSNDQEIQDRNRLKVVSGRGKSLFAESSGNECYFLEKISENEWLLTIFPEQKFVSDPARGKAFRPMANRYVNCLKEAPVSILMEKKIDFKLNAFTLLKCRNEKSGDVVFPDSDGRVFLTPGSYRLEIVHEQK